MRFQRYQDSQVMPDVSDRSGEEDVVLTGLSGRLPESDSIEEFARQLFAGEDLVTADGRRWTPGLYGLPERCGKLKDLAHFDAMFFGVHGKQAQFMDPQLRLLLEVTHEALVDAGLNPTELRGSRTAVYVGGSNSDTSGLRNADTSGYALTGCTPSMFPNRVSYTFDLKGPSLAIDTGCSSSMVALVQAANAIRAGQCDAAIVAGANLCLSPHCSVSLHRLRMLSPEGRCAAFDSSANGYVRSEAVVAVLLQRQRDARRLYCTVRGARVNNDGYKEQGITYPSGAMQSRLAVETFAEARLHPADIAYVEAHGTGTEVGDPEEVNAIAELFCENRQTPLLLGSVKSNMGHSEPVCGLCSIAKVVVAMESGVIPGNLHFKSPNNNIPALSDGRIKVVDQNTPWQGGLVSLNSFGFGGANAHVILESRGGARPPPAEHPAPRLVLASGRTREAVERLLKLAAEHQRDAELHALIDAVHSRAIPGHPYRGYAVLDPSRDASPVIDILESDGEPRPVWFLFSGMGSQCPGVGRALLRLPSFAASVARSAATLEPYGVDVVHLITEAPAVAFDNAINSFVSIAAVQVALVDVLYELGVRPDGIVGSSFGEIGGAYADGALSAAQALLCAYWRGRSLVDAKLPPGAMAVVGVPWEKIKGRCPADVECVCIHFIDNILIAGSPASIDEVVAELTAEGVFTKRVDSSGVAFHSKMVADAAPLLQASLLQVIPEPKPRSARWLSTSVPQDQWNSDLGKLCDAAYFVNNLLSPVQFSAVMAMVPERALLVEVAPQALMQALLRGALPGAKHVPLLRREAPDALSYLLSAVGQAYAAGVQPQVSRLYPSVSWPVSRGTPALASHVGWDHSEEWSVAQFTDCSTSENVIEYDLGKPDDAYIAEHEIDGKILFPAAGYLNLVWRTLAKMNNLKMEETAVVLEQVKFRHATMITRDVPVQFFISLLGGTGEFEISESGIVAVTGVARLANDADVEHMATEVLGEIVERPDDSPMLEAEDIYKQLRLRGLNYHGVFRGIESSNARGTRGLINWNQNWIAFMDSMIQYVYIGDTNSDHRLPVSLQRVVIDPVAHRSATIQGGAVPIKFCRSLDVVTAGGVEIRGLKRLIVTRLSDTQRTPRLDKCVFIPLLEARLESEDTERSKVDALTAALQLTIENCGVFKLNLTELVLQMSTETPLLSYAVPQLETEPHAYVTATLLAGANAPQYVEAMEPLGIKVSHEDAASGGLEANCHVVLCRGALARQDVLATLAAASSVRGSVVLEERPGALDDAAAQAQVRRAGLVLVSRVRISSCEYLLLRRAITLPTARLLLELPADDEYSWVETLNTAMKRAESEDMRVYVWSRAPDSGLLGLATCLRREPGGDRLRFYYLPGAEDAFDPDAPEYREQVQRDLVVNVLRAGVWGTFRHLLLDDTASAIQVEHAYVNTQTRGDLSSLRWIESDLRHAAAAPCRVYYAPLNFRDVMLATGKLSPDVLPIHLAGQECILGLEFSGRSSAGERVMGIVAARGLATTVLADEGFLWKIPAQWSLEEAATVPVAYATAYYALAVRGRVRRGESVLVHAGAGGVGQAAIAIALHAGCTVFTTVGTPDKRAFLRERFPRLPEANVGNSRDCSFERLVLWRTRGRGVDLVLNSLAGDKLQASLRCLAAGGRFLEIGKLDLSNDSSLGMAVLLRNTTMYGIQLDALFDGDHPDKAEVVRHVTEGIASGVVRPLPATVYTDSQLEQAFRYMATGKHIGKVLIRVREEEAGSAPAPTRLISATPRTYMHPAKSYVLVGGLGGFGLELGSWLASRGARTLVFNSRSGVRTGYQAWCIWRWRSAGVRVLVSTTDATAAAGARALLEEAAAAAPVGGVFNLAAVLRVGYLENLTPEDFFVSAKPKFNATGALDLASRELAPELDYFVAFSSVASGRGERGMGAYGLANSTMERICERRRADGLPALAVQWGAIADVGMIINYYGLKDPEVGSTKPQRITSCLKILDALLASRHAVAASMVVEKRRSKDQLTQDLMSTVANILGIKNASKVAPTATLVELGLDSLMTTEIKMTLERSYDVFLNERETRLLTFAKLRALSETNADKQRTVQTTFDT